MVPQPFDALSASQWRVLRARGWETALAPGEVLSRKGASRGSVLVVRQGLLRASAVSAEGKRFTFRLLHPGETSGEASLVADLPSLADISAVRPSAVLQLPRSACLSLLKDNPAFAEAMLRAVSGRLHDIATGMERLALLDVRGRLADVLRHLARAEGICAGCAIRALRRPRGLMVGIGLSQCRARRLWMRWWMGESCGAA